MVAASRGPMPGTSAISASDAAEIAFTDPNFFSSAARLAGPRPGTESSAETVAAFPRLARW
jgi:hypothetical protein